MRSGVATRPTSQPDQQPPEGRTALAPFRGANLSWSPWVGTNDLAPFKGGEPVLVPVGGDERSCPLQRGRTWLGPRGWGRTILPPSKGGRTCLGPLQRGRTWLGPRGWGRTILPPSEGANLAWSPWVGTNGLAPCGGGERSCPLRRGNRLGSRPACRISRGHPIAERLLPSRTMSLHVPRDSVKIRTGGESPRPGCCGRR